MNILFKNPFVLLVAASALVGFNPTPGIASDLSVTQAHTIPGARNAEVVSLARRAFLRFTAACLAHDQSRIAQAVTADVVLEYDLPDPGITLTVDNTALNGLCAASAPKGTASRISNLLIFPMTDPHTVFIQYQAPSRPDGSASGGSKQYMAIVELRGDRIARIRDFTTTPGEIASIATVSAHNTIP